MRNRHINIKELEAVDRSLETLGEKIRGRNIVVRIDNQVAMAYVNRMTGRVKGLAANRKEDTRWENEVIIWKIGNNRKRASKRVTAKKRINWDKKMFKRKCFREK